MARAGKQSQTPKVKPNVGKKTMLVPLLRDFLTEFQWISPCLACKAHICFFPHSNATCLFICNYIKIY